MEFKIGVWRCGTPDRSFMAWSSRRKVEGVKL